MSDINVSQLLEQMRIASSRIKTLEPQVSDPAKLPDFGNVLSEAVNSVNDRQMEAKQLATSFETGVGDTDLVDVMLAIQKADVSFKAMAEVRNKLVDAYKEIMNMPV